MAKRLTRLKISEVSSVDRGAGEGVKVVLFKRDFSSKERSRAADSGAAMPDGSYPIKNVGDLKNAIQAVGRASDPAAAKRHIISRARALGATDELPDGWVNKALEKILADTDLTVGKDGKIVAEYSGGALAKRKLSDDTRNRVEDSVDVFCKSCLEIMASGQIVPLVEKEALLEKSFGEFAEHIGELGTEDEAPAIAAAMFEALQTEDVEMDPKELEALKTKAAEAEKLAKETETLKAEMVKKDAELAFAKMSDAHKAHAEKLSGDARAKFLALSADERDAAMKKALEKRDEDPVFKAMNERIAKAESENAELKKRLDIEADEKEKIAFGKRAVEVYAQPEAFGETLRKAYKGDAAAQTEVEKVTLSMRRVAEQSALFKNFGTGGGNADSAKAQINAKAAELRKLDTKLSQEQAYSKILMDPSNRELAARVRDEERRGI
jgi:hypothetical protein